MTAVRDAAAARRAAYEAQGFIVERGLFTTDEVSRLGALFNEMHAAGGVPGKYAPMPADADYNDGYHHTFAKGDPLLRWPRVMWPHSFMPGVLPYVLHPRIYDRLAELLGEEACNLSSMFYFKPPRARGQAFHQDNFYIKVKPGTCHACWIAVDPSDAGNGGLSVVPGSHRMEIVCPEIADPANYFAKELVRPPAGLTAVMPELAAGDALFFHGNLIHGSDPNTSADRFRRSLVLHYMAISAEEVAKYDTEPLDRHGRVVMRRDATGGGPCGTPHDAVVH